MMKKCADADDLVFAIGALVRRLRAMGTSQALSWTEAAVVGRLSRHGAATIAELARAEGMKPQSMGAAVATLEEAGLVGRQPHPTDGRQVLIELTPKGHAVRKLARDAKLAWLEQAIARLEPQERATLFAAGDIIARLVESDA